MPTSKKPRKKYSPGRKFLRLVSKTNAAVGRRTLSSDSQLRVLTANHDAMLTLTRGEGGHNEWEAVAAALHIGGILDEISYASQCADIFEAAIRAHAECGARYVMKGRPTYTGPELAAVNAALECHDVQVEQATVNEMERALNRCQREADDHQCKGSPVAQANRRVAELAGREPNLLDQKEPR